MEPIAIYEASSFEFRGRAELYADSVRAVGTIFLSADYDTTIPLSTPQPRFECIKMRSRFFGVGSYMLRIGVVGASVLVTEFKLNPLGIAIFVLGCIGGTGLALTLATVRKTEHARFLTEGGMPALDIVRSGKDQERFEEFVNLLVEQIKMAHSRGQLRELW
jgi:hypothetical protein